MWKSLYPPRERYMRQGDKRVSKCYNCSEVALWIADRMVFPAYGEVEHPNPDMPADVQIDYIEASSILKNSPRGAAALLRLAIQKLCVELGGSGRNINDDIALLVSKGLDRKVQQALDIVRVIGNNAVHPGEINLKDDRKTAESLFALVNLIVDAMISQPRHLDSMFGSLPQGARDAISKRDS